MDEKLALVAVLDGVDIGIVVLDQQARVVLWNHWIENASGIAAGFAAKHELAELFPELKGGRVLGAVEDALQQGFPSILSQSLNKSPFPFFSQVTPGGTRQRMQQRVRVMPLREVGVATQCLIEIQDVSLAVHREKILGEQRKFLNTILESEPECVLVLAPTGELMQMNRAGLDMLEVADIAEVKVAGFAAFILPEHRAAFDQLCLAVRTRERSVLEFQVSGRTGTRRWLETHAAPLLDAHGGVTALLFVARDITERKAYEVELRKFKAIVECSNDAIISKSLNDTILGWNHAAESIFGYTADEAIGQSIQMLVPAERMNEEPEILARISRGERVDHFETVRLRKDGQLIDISAAISPILNDTGNVIGASTIARDISEHKKAEKEMERLAQTDVLTGLSNRRHFMILAERELTRSGRYGGKLSVLMIDIDHFKRVNDTYGHQAGDLVLQRLGSVCRKTLRDIDVIGRLGGEEFAVVLPQTDSDRAIEVGDRLRKMIENTTVPLEHEPPLHFTVSVGVAIVVGDLPSLDSLLGQADQALYAAKRSGRNRVCVYSAD